MYRCMCLGTDRICLRAAQGLAPVAIEVHADLGARHDAAELLHSCRMRSQDVVDAIPCLGLQESRKQILLGPVVNSGCDPSISSGHHAEDTWLLVQ